jgi:hypothetical protein
MEQTERTNLGEIKRKKANSIGHLAYLLSVSPDTTGPRARLPRMSPPFAAFVVMSTPTYVHKELKTHCSICQGIHKHTALKASL